MHDGTGSTFLADCPARLATEILSDKWAALVLTGLRGGPRRHGELIAMIGGISRKVLTQTLRRLQGYGLVDRHVEDAGRIEYALTALGATLIGPIESLNDWGRDHAGHVVDFQDQVAVASGD
jgi:DNA-binding HxlR family transcriptional regulator